MGSEDRNRHVPERIPVVGAGAAGRALSRALVDAGYAIASVANRTPEKAVALAELLGARKAGRYMEDVTDPCLVIFAVPDDQLEAAARDTSNRIRHPAECLAIHLSGVRSSASLGVLAARGAATASCHPMLSLRPDSEPSVFRGARFHVEGDPRAVVACVEIATAIGAVPKVIDEQMKLAIHLAASIASNYLVTLMSVAADILEAEGIDRGEYEDLLRPLVESTVRNIRFGDPLPALTGPVRRGDIETLRRHARMLRDKHPHRLPLVEQLIATTARSAEKAGQITREEADTIVRILREITESSRP
ncbi:MAG: Rossmann-like and DUF2520 domain-containing protein [Rhodothermales bacterium]|nr:Rossmann-like and DUF2520 domain-containing protein [Rhodothermales bacterium]